MNASKVGLGAVLLATSGLTLEAAGLPGATVPIVLAAVATAGVATSVITARTGRSGRRS
jgi:hypothetical protein